MIYARLERFLDYIAELNGHERIPDEPTPKFKPAWRNSSWARAKERGARVTAQQDAQNTVDLIKLVNGEITEAELIAERGYKCADSVRNSFYSTNRRGGFGDYKYLYEQWKEMMMR